MSLLLFLACWFGGAPAWADVIERVEVHGDRVAIRFDRAVTDASSLVLTGPRRIAVDVGGVAPGQDGAGGGAVAGIRQWRRGVDGARVELDLTRPTIVSEGALTGDGRTLTLRLRTVDDAGFARAALAGRQSFLPPFNFGGRAAARPGRGYSVSLPIPTPSRTLPLPPVAGDGDRPLVVIDAGHGGHDPGASSPDGAVHEKDITLKIAKAIRDALLKSGRVRVAMTRDDDRYLILQERYGIARKLHASLFISIHCDSVGAGGAEGASVYTLSEVASDKEAAKLAARENKADIIAGVDLGDAAPDISSILIDLTQRETMNSSAQFARLLGREAGGLVPFKPNFHRMASLVVLKAPDLPSILFETGYLSNPRDVAFLDSADGRKRIAEGVRRAVEVHFARRLAAVDGGTGG